MDDSAGRPEFSRPCWRGPRIWFSAGLGSPSPQTTAPHAGHPQRRPLHARPRHALRKSAAPARANSSAQATGWKLSFEQGSHLLSPEFSNVVPTPVASAPAGNSLEVQILRPWLRLLSPTLGVGPRSLQNSPAGGPDAWGHLPRSLLTGIVGVHLKPHAHPVAGKGRLALWPLREATFGLVRPSLLAEFPVGQRPRGRRQPAAKPERKAGLRRPVVPRPRPAPRSSSERWARPTRPRSEGLLLLPTARGKGVRASPPRSDPHRRVEMQGPADPWPEGQLGSQDPQVFLKKT